MSIINGRSPVGQTVVGPSVTSHHLEVKLERRKRRAIRTYTHQRLMFVRLPVTMVSNRLPRACTNLMPFRKGLETTACKLGTKVPVIIEGLPTLSGLVSRYLI